MLGRLFARPRDRPRQQDGCSRDDARERRCGKGLSLHHQPGHRVGRRSRDGLSGPHADREHGIHPVPSHLPVPSCRQIVPDFGGVARRGRDSAPARRHSVHEEVPSRRRTRAARYRGPRNRRRDEAARARLRVPRPESQGRRFYPRAFSEHLQAMPQLRLRPYAGADSGGAGGALYVRRRNHRPQRAHRDPAPVRGGRGRDDRAARRQPPRVELAAGSGGDGLARDARGAGRNRERTRRRASASSRNGKPDARFAARSACWSRRAGTRFAA